MNGEWGTQPFRPQQGFIPWMLETPEELYNPTPVLKCESMGFHV